MLEQLCSNEITYIHSSADTVNEFVKTSDILLLLSQLLPIMFAFSHGLRCVDMKNELISMDFIRLLVNDLYLKMTASQQYKFECLAPQNFFPRHKANIGSDTIIKVAAYRELTSRVRYSGDALGIATSVFLSIRQKPLSDGDRRHEDTGEEKSACEILSQVLVETRTKFARHIYEDPVNDETGACWATTTSCKLV